MTASADEDDVTDRSADGAAPPDDGTDLAPLPVDARTWVEGVAGTWVPVPRPDARPAQAAARGATWVVVGRTADVAAALGAAGADVRTVEWLQRHLDDPDGLGPAALRARADRMPGGGLVLRAPTLLWAGADDVLTGRVLVVVHDDVVVTAEDGAADVLATAVERVTQGRRPTGERGARAVLAAVMLTLVEGGADVELAAGEAVADLEQHVLAPRPVPGALAAVYALKREIAEARRALAPLGAHLPELVEDLLDGQETHRHPAWLRRVTASADRTDHRLDAHDALLGDMLAVHLAQVSVQQNEDMRRISAWAAVIAVPTLVAGVYGMNFEHMPELAWPWGYPAAVVAMVGLGSTVWRLLRRSGWL